MARRHRRSWTSDQKRALVAEARARRRTGASLTAIADELDIQVSSLLLWMRQFPESSIQEVAIVAEPVRSNGAVALVTPDGFRFEGLELSSAAWLWRQLR